ncbi:SGT1 protein-domain-containing protein [Lipomyces japonicus]|uniref:SGT1 protein-domain-containing protein n=1 Tax=Lipomyces japonicus TaxID=56871 RepID=UPI0034CD0B3E
MDIFSAVANLADDCCEYYIFLADDPHKKVTDLQVKRNKLQKIAEHARQLSKPWIEGYIWQREGFDLKLDETADEPCLKGLSEFGDCIDDEWFIVFILRTLSKEHPDIFIKITDNDGEFLLIEAANAIPKWLGPENADNRVWIYKGNVCIIPEDAESISFKAFSISKALGFLNDHPQDLYRPKILQDEAFSRIQAYPQAAKSHIHRARVILPRTAAQILYNYPAYIAPISESFMLRDPITMKVCDKMPNFPPEDSVECTIKFTKLIYAQLKAQRIVPLAKFNLPKREEKDYDKAELGMKVACGLEMLFAIPPSSDGKLSKIKTEIEEILKKTKSSTNEEISKWDTDEDSDNWLDMDFSQLEDMLNFEHGIPSVDTEDNATTQQEVLESQQKVKALVDKLRRFTEDENAGLDGVEFEDEFSESDGEDNDNLSDDGSMPNSSRIEEIEPNDDVNEDEFLEFFLKEALNLSPEEIEQFRSDAVEDTEPTAEQIEHELREKGILGEDEDDDLAIVQSLLNSIKSQEGGAGPGSNLLSLLGRGVL